MVGLPADPDADRRRLLDELLAERHPPERLPSPDPTDQPDEQMESVTAMNSTTIVSRGPEWTPVGYARALRGRIFDLPPQYLDQITETVLQRQRAIRRERARQVPGPARLTDHGPVAACNRCRRTTVARQLFGKACRKNQPDGSRCPGMFSYPKVDGHG